VVSFGSNTFMTWSSSTRWWRWTPLKISKMRGALGAGQFRSSDAPALLVECMLSQGTLGRSDSIFSGPPSWLRNGNIVITAATEAKFDSWYRANSGISVAGKTLTEWAQWTAANDRLPAEVCGLATTVIVVADGCADGTAKEAMTAGALVADVPVNRGQGAALRLGYRLARDGGAAYIVTTDADGQYNPAEIERVLAPVVAGEADFVTGSRRLGSQETHDFIRRAGVLFFAGSLSLLTGQKISDTTFGLRAMRSEVTGAVRLQQPQYQASELLIGVITHGYKVAEVPATIHRRRIGESKKGQNPLYGLHLPGVNNLFYGIRFARVIYGTWWRERQRSRSGSAGRPGSETSSGVAARAKGSGPGSVDASASSATAGAGRPADPAKRT